MNFKNKIIVISFRWYNIYYNAITTRQQCYLRHLCFRIRQSSHNWPRSPQYNYNRYGLHQIGPEVLSITITGMVYTKLAQKSSV